MTSWPQWLTFDPHPAASRIKAPIAMVHGLYGAIPKGAEKLYANFGACSRRLVWVEEGNQFDFHVREPTVTEAAGIAAGTSLKHSPGAAENGPGHGDSC